MAETGSDRWWQIHSIRGFFAAAAVLVLVCGGLFVFFVKGLYLLPDRMCEGSVQRDVVIKTLPRARAADAWSDHRGRGTDFMFGCRVSTSADSILSGSVNLRESSKSDWERGYGSDGGTRVVRTSAGRAAGLAQLDDGGVASVYVPCEPKGAGEAGVNHALVAEAAVTGKSRASGAERRQDLTDFAYQLTRHAYTLAGCRGPSDFPERLPRYEEH